MGQDRALPARPTKRSLFPGAVIAGLRMPSAEWRTGDRSAAQRATARRAEARPIGESVLTGNVVHRFVVRAAFSCRGCTSVEVGGAGSVQAGIADGPTGSFHVTGLGFG